MPVVCPTAVLVLVGTMVDLRDSSDVMQRLGDKGQHAVTCGEGIACAKELGLAAYAETSALTGEGVKALFQTCYALFLQGQKALKSGQAEKRKCVLQ